MGAPAWSVGWSSHATVLEQLANAFLPPLHMPSRRLGQALLEGVEKGLDLWGQDGLFMERRELLEGRNALDSLHDIP